MSTKPAAAHTAEIEADRFLTMLEERARIMAVWPHGVGKLSNLLAEAVADIRAALKVISVTATNTNLSGVELKRQPK